MVARLLARDNYDNHFVCEPRATEMGQNGKEEQDDVSTTAAGFHASQGLPDALLRPWRYFV
jgi:hypothetical protein